MTLRAKDGTPLNLLASSMRHEGSVIMVNAPGVSCTVAEQLMRGLDEHGLNFATWDLRGSPGVGDGFREYRTSHHVDDLEAVLGALRPQRYLLAAWCSGTPTVLSALAQRRVAPEACVAFCVPNFAEKPRLNLPGDTLEKVCSVVVRDEQKLSFFYDTMISRSGLDKLTADIPDPPLRDAVLAPFKSGPEALLRYAWAIQSRPAPSDVRAWCASVEVPLVFIGGRQDAMVSYQDAVALAACSRAATHRVIDDWTHYSLFYDLPTVLREFDALLRVNRDERSRPRRFG